MRPGWRGAVRGNVLVLGVVSLLTDLSSEMIYPLLPVFISGLVPVSLAAIYVGLMEGVAESVSSLLKVFSGRLSDAIGKRKLLAVVGYGISTLSRPCMALAAAGWHVVGLRFLDRVGKGIRTAPRDALISDSVDAEVRGLAFGFHRAMDNAGAVLGSASSLLVLWWFLGYGLWNVKSELPTAEEMSALRWLFGLAILPGLFATWALVAKVREIAPSRAEMPGGDEARQSRLPRRFYAFLGIVTLFTLGNSSDLFLLFYGKTRFQLSLLMVVLVWVVLHISKVLFSVPGGMLSDRLGRRAVIATGWVVYTAVYVGMAVLSREWTFWALIIAYGAYYGLTEGAEKALVADYVKSEQRGRAYGLYHGAVGAAALPASLVFGVFWAKLGPAIAFAIGASLAGLASVLLMLLLAARRAGADPGPAL